MERTVVLCYHGVSETWPSELAVTPTQLDWQLRMLVRRGYRPVTFRDATSAPADGRRFAVTFDDAYRSVGDLAAPILARLGVPGSVYVPTDWADREEPMRWRGIDQWIGGAYEDELLPMSWDGLERLRDAGWEVGSHTCSHPHLTELDDHALQHELSASKAACESALGQECATLAYPYGDVDDRVVAAAVAAGYQAAAALPGHPGTAEELRRARVGIYRWDGKARFRLKLSPTVERIRARPVRRLIDPVGKLVRRGPDR